METTTAQSLMNQLKSQVEAMKASGGGSLPYAWAFGEPMTEEQFKQMNRDRGANVISTTDIAKQRLHAKLGAMRMKRAGQQAKEQMVSKMTKNVVKNSNPENQTPKSLVDEVDPTSDASEQ